MNVQALHAHWEVKSTQQSFATCAQESGRGIRLNGIQHIIQHILPYVPTQTLNIGWLKPWLNMFKRNIGPIA